MSAPVSVLGLATAVPDHVIEQSAVVEVAQRIYAKMFTRYPRLADVFANAGIERRYSVRPLDWFMEPRDWRARTEAYLDGAGALFVRAAERALAQAGLGARDVDIIVTVSSTGIATPSLEARVGGAFGFRSSASRVPVFGLGCAGGVSGLSLAARLARSEPGAVVLVVVVELCTLAFRADRQTKADVISSALFGDGAAAVVLRAEPQPAPLSLIAAAEHTWPGTLDIMGWSVDPVGFGVVLSRSLPRFVERRLAAPVRRFMKCAGLDAPRLVCHPGGAKVLEAVETALDLQKATLRDEREVLRNYGNMSAPTVLFVLERVINEGLRGEAVLCALGPGFTASFVALEAAYG
jgi:alkylresorcinol/alkylpyrone synthase